jgi:hypothetical protein
MSVAEVAVDMGGLDDRPWVWCGLPALYVSWPGDRQWRTWSADETDGADAARTLPPLRVPRAGGGQWAISGIGPRLGLPASGPLEALQLAVLQALVQALAPAGAPRPWLFAPPAQCGGLSRLAARLREPPAGIALDAALLTPRSPGAWVSGLATPSGAPVADPLPAQGGYVYDWRDPSHLTPHAFDPAARPEHRLPLPALLAADGLGAVRLEPLSYLAGESLRPARYRLRCQPGAVQGRAALRFGLVWAWGRGPALWQWALPPVHWPRDSGSIELHLVSPDLCRLVGADGLSDEHRLLPPTLRWVPREAPRVEVDPITPEGSTPTANATADQPPATAYQEPR